ncbi:FAD-dependent oxidoreductase [Sphingomonas sp. MAH-20]|uniref:FAD-dependent oxidoreductase n=1 Tax=Sphingomonas horti TaxID=2682842 RepID=A0A6I4IY87_9SPHN|nr:MULTISPECIES: FAD-binding oxidoreductase [Sphingomonas]MBA2918200.1 FAD-binding oxidoreductase [Sphingomonas sp. CGMCC 1.13658]MVO77169.1 FAD-dependent oxidoreductase [Sphingomonas horti]
MTKTADFLIIGGGVAGLSVGARLAQHGKVVLIEAEDAVGYHSSGRSVTFSHFGIGGATVRALTAYSRAFFQSPPDGFDALAAVRPALFIANQAMLPALDELERITRAHADAVERLDAQAAAHYCPALRWAPDAVVAAFVHREGLKLDPHALLQGFARTIRAAGGEVVTGARAVAIGPRWRVQAESGETYEAPVLVNAAGAWADRVAEMAGVRPLGLTPLRRTIIVFDPPAEMDVRDWPFVKTAVDYMYMMPDSGRLLASPVDENPDDPGDAQPDELDMAVAAHRVSEFTTLEVRRITHRWAGLRTFAADRVPVAGYAPDADGFFWLAGQGGYGLQTAPAMAEIAEALALGAAWPDALAAAGLVPEQIRPERLPAFST